MYFLFNINTKFFAIQKILQGINFVKITKNIFRPPTPKETKKTPHRCGDVGWFWLLLFLTKNRWPQRIPVKITKKNTKKKTRGTFIFKNFGVNGIGFCPALLLSHLGSLWGAARRVTFESLLGQFNSFWASVDLGARWLPNARGRIPARTALLRRVLAGTTFFA